MNTTPRPASGDAITYASAGVDTAAGDRAVELMKEAVAATHGPDVLGALKAMHVRVATSGAADSSPSVITAPLPNALSICASAMSKACSRLAGFA